MVIGKIRDQEVFGRNTNQVLDFDMPKCKAFHAKGPTCPDQNKDASPNLQVKVMKN
jgi:hypothetical protein